MDKKDQEKQKIHLSGNKYLISDGSNLYIARKTKSAKTGNDYYQRLSGYHTDYEHVFESYFLKEVKAEAIEGEIKDLVAYIKRVRTEIRSWYGKFDRAWKENADD